MSTALQLLLLNGRVTQFTHKHEACGDHSGHCTAVAAAGAAAARPLHYAAPCPLNLQSVCLAGRVSALLAQLEGRELDYAVFARDTPAGKDCRCCLLRARAWAATLPGALLG